ncbi:MAG: hypothetical protein M0R05_03940 [Bacilli bacterium]|nr:hypothetical protein [Bacilli bacterium]MDD4077188.1 hypothetical protein [Bacilli bacterium]
MKKERQKILIRYNNYPDPVIGVHVIANTKGLYTIVAKTEQKLEKFQVKEGLIVDNKVVAEKIIKELALGDKDTEDEIIVLYDTPDLLCFNTILPKAGRARTKKLAKKELNEFFRTNSDTYKQINRIINRKDGGIIFYIDLIPGKLINSLEELSNLMNKYIESSVSFIQAVAGAFEERFKNPLDTFIVFRDGVSCHVLLLFESKLIDSIALYNSNPPESEIYSNLEILRSKHLFAYEKKETNHILFIVEEEDIRSRYESFFTNEKLFEIVQADITYDDIIITAAKYAGDYIDGFYIRI